MRIELHSHTSEGSSCAHDAADLMVERAWRECLDALCVADHDSLAGFRSLDRTRIPEDIVVVPAVEVSLGEKASGAWAHVVVVGADEGVLAGLDRRGRGWPSLASAEEALGTLDRSRTFVTWAHPLDCLGTDGRPLPEALRLMELVDAVEVRNGGYKEMPPQSSVLFAAFRSRGLAEVVGSDAHYRGRVARETLVVPGTPRTPADVVGLLKSAGSFGFEGPLPRGAHGEPPREKYLTK